MWSSPKLYDHGFTAGALFFPDGYSYSLPVLPHGGRDPPARIVGWFDLRHIFPQGGRRTTLQGGFRKEVGRKKVAFGHYSPIQYTIRIYAVSTIYCMYIILYYTIYCYHSRMGGGKFRLWCLRAAAHNLRTWPKHHRHHFVYVFLFAPRPIDGVFNARSSDHPNCFMRLLTVP